MIIKSIMGNIAIAGTTWALSVSPAVAQAPISPWSAIQGTVSRSFIPLATSCPGGSGNSCVAVGYNGESAALIENSSGGTWHPVSTGSPNPGQFYASSLSAISCINKNFCVAVGKVQPESDPEAEDPLIATLIDRTWSFSELDISGPNTGYTLTGISCANKKYCVAVGSVGSGTDYSHNVVITFGGRSWSTTMLPNPGNYPNAIGGLTSISCPAAKRCTAVGFYSTDQQEDLQGFAETYNGRTWAVNKTPLLTGSNALFSVDCFATSKCIAVGDQAGQEQTLVEQFAMKSWSVLGDSGAGQLRSVACVNSMRCAAVGYTSSHQPLVLTYANRIWSTTNSTNPLDDTYNLGGVSCPNISFCVAAGWGVGGAQQSLEGYLMSGAIPRT